MQQPIEAGQILNGKYKIIRLIGEGGMARVWLAEEVTFGQRRVAIKEPKTESDADQHADAQRRFTQELEINAALGVGTSSVVPTYTVEQWGDRPLLVMRYMAGGDLDSRIRAAGEGLPVESVVAIARSLLTALQAAHSHPWEIVHRDIKPANVLFDEAGNAYLADFGLAQLSGSSSNRTKLMGGAQPGTPSYMAPEQSSSTAPLTPAADIYALGCVLFEMLTGKRYKRMKPGTRVTELRRDVPAWLDALVASAVAEDPWQRFEDGAAMLAALNAGKTRPTVPVSNRWMAAVGVLLVLALITWGASRWFAPPEGDPAPTPPLLAENLTPVVTPTPNLDTTATEGALLAPAETATPTPSNTATPTPSDTATPAPTPDLEATIAADMAATNTAVALANPPTQTASPTDIPTLTPTATPTAEATPTPVVIRINPPPFTSTPVVTPTHMTGATRINPVDGAVYVYVPAGSFDMGSNNGNSDEKPVHRVTLDGFWMMQTEVTNAQYGQCVAAGVCTVPNNSRWNGSRYAQHPVTSVDWNQATTYARWVGGRLPTEAEWEKACRGTDKRTYPWGNQSPTTALLNFNNNIGDTTVVGSHAAGASPYGALDMVGNVWEWTEDWYASDYFAISLANIPAGSATGIGRVLRGGAFLDDGGFVRCTVRYWSTEADRLNNVGFRVAALGF